MHFSSYKQTIEKPRLEIGVRVGRRVWNLIAANNLTCDETHIPRFIYLVAERIRGMIKTNGPSE